MRQGRSPVFRRVRPFEDHHPFSRYSTGFRKSGNGLVSLVQHVPQENEIEGTVLKREVFGHRRLKGGIRDEPPRRGKDVRVRIDPHHAHFFLRKCLGKDSCAGADVQDAVRSQPPHAKENDALCFQELDPFRRSKSLGVSVEAALVRMHDTPYDYIRRNISYNRHTMLPNTTLELLIDGQIIFTSAGKWLHPLFELEQFLRGRKVDLRKAEIHDKIIGRGSAFLITRMGIRTVHAGVLSMPGKDVLDRAGASCTWESLVDTIQCRTEGLLRDTTDPETAYRVLADLAGADRRTIRDGSVASPLAPGS